MDSDIQNEADSNEARIVDIAKTVNIADILRASRRIQVIIELDSASENGMTVGSLADALAKNEPDSEDSDARRSVYVALVQAHLPKLVSECVVAWDRVTVSRGTRFDEVISALHRLQE